MADRQYEAADAADNALRDAKEALWPAITSATIGKLERRHSAVSDALKHANEAVRHLETALEAGILGETQED